MTTVTLLLPLSSLWAGMATNSETSSLNIGYLTKFATSQPRSADPRQKIFRNAKFSSISTSQSSQVLSEHKDSFGPVGPNTTIDTVIEYVPTLNRQRDSTEMDLEAMGVKVHKSYSVHSGKATMGGVGME